MKRKILYIAALALFFASCQKNAVTEHAEGIPVEIDVAPVSGSLEVSGSRAPIYGWFNTEVYMAYGQSSTEGLITSAAPFTSVLRGTITDGKTVFQPLLLYPTNGDYIYIRGFYPRSGITNLASDGYIPDNEIHYSITGNEDIMVSNMVYGSQHAPISDKYLPNLTVDERAGELHYQHLLTQMRFKVLCNQDFPAELYKLKKITITGLSTRAILYLDKMVADPDVLSFQLPRNGSMIVYDNPVGGAMSSSLGITSQTAMFEHKAPFAVEVEFTSGDRITVSSIKVGSTELTTGNTQRGVAYEITLTVQSTTTSPIISASGKEWVAGDDNGLGQEGWW